MGCWLFNEGAGKYIFDLLGKTKLFGVNNPSWVPTNAGIASNFNGTDQYYTVDSSPITSVPITLFAWFINNTINNSYADRRIFEIGHSITTYEGWCLKWYEQGSNSHIRAATIENGSSVQATSPSGLAVNTPHLAVAVYASNSSRIAYNDGKPGTEETTLKTPGTIDQVRFGTRTRAAGETFAGKILFAGVYNRALASSEIQHLYAIPYSFLLPALTRRFFIIGGGTPHTADLTLSSSTSFADSTTAAFLAALSLAGNPSFASSVLAAFRSSLTLSGTVDFSSTGLTGIKEAAMALAISCGFSGASLAGFKSAMALSETLTETESVIAAMAVGLVLQSTAGFEAIGSKIVAGVSSLPMFRLGLQ